MAGVIGAVEIGKINLIEERKFYIRFINEMIQKHNYFSERLEYLESAYCTGGYERDKREILEEMDDIINYWLYNLDYLIGKHEKMLNEIDLKIKIDKCRAGGLVEAADQ